MYHYLNDYAFFKHTYGKPFLVRLDFEVNLPGRCCLEADNVCKCDSWFVKDENKLEIRYHVVYNGELLKQDSSLVKKSILIDLNKPIDNNGEVKLTITNTAGLIDTISVKYSELNEDFISFPN